MKLTKADRVRHDVLSALANACVGSEWGEDTYFPFAGIMERTGFDRPTVRRACRVLRRRGHTEYRNGLWNDEGPAGAGYRITPAGREALAQHNGDGE